MHNNVYYNFMYVYMYTTYGYTRHYCAHIYSLIPHKLANGKLMCMIHFALQLMDYIRDMPTLTRHLFQELFSPRGIFLLWKVRVFLLIILVLLYVLSPLDIIPESIFGLVGIIDDIVITMLIVFLLTFIYRTAIVQHRN